MTDFIKKHDSVLIPLYKQTNLASWDAAISGKPEDFKKAEDLKLKMMALFANKESLKKLEEIKVSGTDHRYLLTPPARCPLPPVPDGQSRYRQTERHGHAWERRSNRNTATSVRK